MIRELLNALSLIVYEIFPLYCSLSSDILEKTKAGGKLASIESKMRPKLEKYGKMRNGKGFDRGFDEWVESKGKRRTETI